MENEKKQHNLTLEGSSRLLLTGIKDVGAFNESEIRAVLSEGGRVTVSGEKMQISAFDKNTGDLRLTGKVNTIKYFDLSAPSPRRFFK